MARVGVGNDAFIQRPFRITVKIFKTNFRIEKSESKNVCTNNAPDISANKDSKEEASQISENFLPF